jgi:hypothetical protein
MAMAIPNKSTVPNAGTGPKWMNNKQAAYYLGFSTSYLDKMRSGIIGPAYYKPPRNGKILYRKADLDTWMEACRVAPGGVDHE